MNGKKPRLEFTFDVSKALQAIDFDYVFSENTKLCNFDETAFIMQSNLCSKLISIFPDDQKQITKAYERGFCTPCAMYNSYPFAFCHKLDNLAFFVHRNLEHDKFANVKYVVSELNKHFNQNMLHYTIELNKAYDTFTKSIDQDKPLLVTYQYSDTIPSFAKQQHSVSLFGYDENSIYYFENDDDDILIYSLVMYVRDYFKYFNNTLGGKLQKLEPLVQELVSLNTEDDILNLGKQLLGYSKLENRLSRVNKNFLTDTKIFYNVNQIVDCLNYHENYAYVNRLRKSKLQVRYDFASLTERLKQRYR